VRWRLRQWQHSRRLQALAAEVQQRAPAPQTAPVVFFNASARLQGMSQNAAFALLAGWALRMAGTPVVHFTCRAGMTRCVLGTQRTQIGKPPPCAACIQQSRKAFAGADVHWFQDEPDPALEKAIAHLSLSEMMHYRREGMPLGELVLPALRWVLRRHTLEGDSATCFLFRRYIAAAWQIARDFGKLLDEVKPLKVVVFNGTFYPEAAARWAARKRGIPVISHEVALRPYTAYFTRGDATAYPIDIPAEFELSTEQNLRLDAYLEQRFQGNFSMAGVRFWPEMKPLSPEFLERVAQFRQVVPVFTNVVFDTSQGHANVVFAHMFAWLDAVLQLVKAHPETFFVIRAHPDETRPGKESLESVAMWVNHNEVDRLSNVLFVDSRQYFSSYELIQRSKFVMVYNSTIGLEAALMGAVVLCAGKARFTQLPTVFFPQSQNEFLRQAEQFLAADEVEPLPEHRQNARRFLYYQLFKTSLPFDCFIEEDEIRQGYVQFKEFSLDALSPERSPVFKILIEGLLGAGDFLKE